MNHAVGEASYSAGWGYAHERLRAQDEETGRRLDDAIARENRAVVQGQVGLRRPSADIAEILKMRARGESLAAIGHRFGITREAVRQVVLRHGTAIHHGVDRRRKRRQN